MSRPDRNPDGMPVLRRKLTPRSPPPVDDGVVDDGPAAGLARAFGRAVAAGAPLVAEDPVLHRKRASLAELLDTIEPGAFVILLGPGEGGAPAADGAAALALIDQPGFATLIEAMTIGRLGPRPPAERRATATDSALLAGVLDATLAALGAGDPATPLRCSRPVPDHRLLPVLLDEGDYDLVALTTRLVSGDVARPIRVMLALPRPAPAPAAADAPAAAPWAEALEEAVLRVPAVLKAELGRVSLPLSEVLALGTGSALMLPLSNLEEVRLVGLDGGLQAIGRLGQTRGMRAVRLTGGPLPPLPASMIDAAPPPRAAPESAAPILAPLAPRPDGQG